MPGVRSLSRLMSANLDFAGQFMRGFVTALGVFAPQTR
jgi:hypothetical protein